MITKSRFKTLDDKGEQIYVVKKGIEVPLFTSNPSAAGTKTMFSEGSKVKGKKVLTQVQVKNKNVWQPYGQLEGIMVLHEQGYFLVPIDFITWDADPWNENATEVKHSADGELNVEQVTDAAEAELNNALAKPDEKRYFGFSAKQLLVIAGIVFVVSKLSK